MKSGKPVGYGVIALGLIAALVLFYPFPFLQIENSRNYGDYVAAADAYNLYVQKHGGPPSTVGDFMPGAIQERMALPDYSIKVTEDRTVVYRLDSNSSLNRVRLVDVLFQRLSMRGIVIGKLKAEG